MRHPHKWHEMLPEEFYREFERAPVAYLPCGAVEEHGLHNSLAVDPWTAYELCVRAAGQSGGIVHPIVPLAPAGIPGYSREQLRGGSHELFPPSLWVSRELCERTYVELMESMADMGFRVCMAVGGHYPADLLLRDMAEQRGGIVRGMRFWGGGTFRLLEEAYQRETQAEPELYGHGMMWETSCVLAIRPDLVDLSRVDCIRDSPLVSQLQPTPESSRQRIKEATPEFGTAFLERAADRLAGLAREMLTEKA